MRISHKALILAVVTESVTIAWFIVARKHGGVPMILELMHTPAILLVRIGSPWLLAVLIETAVWMLFWFLLLRVFAAPRDELTKLSSADHQDEWQEPQVKKIVPR